MYRSKRFAYTYEDYEEGGKTAKDLFQEIINDAELPSLEEIVIGSWGDPWGESEDDEEKGVQAIVNGIVANKEAFSHIKSLFSEIWIMRTAKFPGLFRRIIPGSGKRCPSWRNW